MPELNTQNIEAASDAELSMTFSVVVEECRRRALLNKSYDKVASALAYNIRKNVGERAAGLAEGPTTQRMKAEYDEYLKTVGRSKDQA